MTPAADRAAVRWDIRPQDREAVKQIVETTRFFTAAEVAVAVELIDERLAKGDASGYHFVFLDADDVVVGYACFGPIACTVHSFDLYWIAVSPQFQRHGIGRRLMELCEVQVRRMNGRRIYVETSGRPQYLSSREFYEQCGYTPAAVLPDFYDEGDDRIVYLKVLSQES